MNVIEGGKSDKERAEEIKKTMLDVLVPVMYAIDNAKAAGFTVEFNLGPGALGKYQINTLKLTKEF